MHLRLLSEAVSVVIPPSSLSQAIGGWFLCVRGRAPQVQGLQLQGALRKLTGSGNGATDDLPVCCLSSVYPGS